MSRPALPPRSRHSRERGNPATFGQFVARHWIPAFAGMTVGRKTATGRCAECRSRSIEATGRDEAP
ncbi:hypothetical protein [Lysobacter gummosus]|uniref:hypothetical protein n=1 Tax=Lysobacter gummosus TaxID=262324 RepID=UPI00362EAEE4